MPRLVPRSVAVLIVALALVPAPSSAATAPGFVSVMFGRMQWVATDDCIPLPNTVTLGQVKTMLDARGIDATGIVITNRLQETGLRCFNGYTTHVGWDTIADWHGQGWSFVSGGTHKNMTSLTYAQQVQESCGSLATFSSRGIDASGLFAYGANRFTTAIQADPVAGCFEFGRRYGNVPNVRSTTVPPWFAKVQSVTGGKCNDPALPCYTDQYVSNYRYHSPAQMALNVQANPDTWYAMQFYRFVQGSYHEGAFRWDCTSPDWRQHFTSHDELYCINDFVMVMDALEAAVAGGVVATDPETVANAWGRVAGTTDDTPPIVTITSPSDGGTVPRATDVTIRATADDVVGVTRMVAKVDGVVLCRVTGSTLTCPWHVPNIQGTRYRVIVTGRDAAGNVGKDIAVVRAV